MAARDILAAVLIAAGTTALSLAAFLVSAPMGFAILGLLLVALGVALGFGEFGEREGHQGPPAMEEAASAPVTSNFPAADGEPPADVAGVTETADLQSLVPLANYLGRTGHAAPVAVPPPRSQP